MAKYPAITKRLKTAEAMRAIDMTLEQGITNLAVNITSTAKKIAPVAEKYGGNLKGSIQWAQDGGKSGGAENSNALTEQPPQGGAIVGTPVEYGVYQEFGTRKMYPQPFLRPAIDIEAKGAPLREAMARAFFDSVPKELKKV